MTFCGTKYFGFSLCLEDGSFLYHEDNSKEFQKNEKIQDTMETVLMCISIAAVVLALILLSALR